ncbi:hypothetical protein ACLB2K_056753 [Fragaria x ananassa]
MRSKAFPVTILCLLCFATSKTLTSLKRGSSLSVEDDSDFLTSPDGTFTCGFHGVGTNAYWFSVWFTGSKDRTIVWMANRDKPVNGLGSRVHLSGDGSMVLTDVDGAIIWKSSTNSSTSTVADRAELLDSGNLVLKDPSGKILWQSFDFPTDTLLPNQHFRKSNKLISNLGRGDFSTGYFSFYFDNDNVLKLMYDGPDISSLYWPDLDYSVFQNGRNAYNSSRVAGLDELGSFSSSDELQFSAFDMGLRVKRRLTMDYDGNLRLYSLDSSTGLWIITWQAMVELCKVHGICGQAMVELCKVHGICGQNGICIYTPGPKCSCPPGYEVADARNLKLGCKPKFKRTCSKSQEEKFVQIPQVDFYGFDLNFSEHVSFDDCRELCLGDCRCEAFSYRLNGEGRCYTKSALFNGYKSPDFVGSIYLRMPASVEVPLLVNKLNTLDRIRLL